MTKKEFSLHVSNNWFLYLIVLGLAFFVSSWSVSACASPNEREKVTIFLTAYGCDEDGLTTYLTEYKADYLKKIELIYHSSEEEYYNVFLQVYAGEADIVIIPESIVNNVGPASYLTLSSKKISTITDETIEYYELNDEYYGIKVHSKDASSSILDEYITYTKEDEENNIIDEDYYLFIKADSLHMGFLTNGEFDGGINILKGIIEYENKESE